MAAPHRGNSTVARAGDSSLAHGEVADLRRSHHHRLMECPGCWCSGRAGPPKIADCGATTVKSIRSQGKEAKEGIFAVIIFRNHIVALFTNSIIY